MKKSLLFNFIVCILVTSCFNDNDDTLKNQFETDNPIATNPIGVDSQLYTNLQAFTSDQSSNPSDCIQFIFPITINKFDEALEFIDFTIIADNEGFIEFLAGVLPEQVISISYPIIYTNDLDEELEITTNEELEESLQSCIDEQLEAYCSGLFTDGECLWRIVNNPDGNNDYEGSVFKISSIGITTFEHNDSVLFGNWTVIAISNQLFFNIYFDETTEVAPVWNKNWYVSIIDDNTMVLQDGDSEVFFIERECNPELCPKYIFEQCEVPEDSGTSNFDLTSYIDCFAANIDISNSTVTFYATETDAFTATNQIISPYMNNTNPQYIYVRIEDNTTGEFSIIQILLAAISC